MLPEPTLNVEVLLLVVEVLGVMLLLESPQLAPVGQPFNVRLTEVAEGEVPPGIKVASRR